ncbi:hypothetical protein [Paenibacillus sp. YYML68]|uniref:hypothetical protein n=1 Tax=Paenibacillus sp. YYML68 TaxID=2909250 RepID=UPI002493465C|nr:hypothetical protein [Paenibacillus sp. YYML68]
MLKKYSFYGIPFELYVVFGLFAAALVMLVAYQWLKVRQESKHAGGRLEEEAR